jgi:hypothetical protein
MPALQVRTIKQGPRCRAGLGIACCMTGQKNNRYEDLKK